MAKHVFVTGGVVSADLVGFGKAGDRKAVQGLAAPDRVPAGDDYPGLVGLVVAAPQDFPNPRLLHAVRNAHHVQGQLRLTAHRVDVGNGIGGGNLAEEIGVVHDGWKEVHSLNQRRFIVDHVHAGVIAPVEADDQVGIGAGPEILQQFCQRAGAHLRAAAGAAGQPGEPRVRLHIRCPTPLCAALRCPPPRAARAPPLYPRAGRSRPGHSPR